MKNPGMITGMIALAFLGVFVITAVAAGKTRLGKTAGVVAWILFETSWLVFLTRITHSRGFTLVPQVIRPRTAWRTTITRINLN